MWWCLLPLFAHTSGPAAPTLPSRHVSPFDNVGNEGLPRPSLSIVVMVVGTRGDVQPFCALGSQLQREGHRVRLATHAEYRDFVTGYGLEFYPLAGNPKTLSQWMVQTGGRLWPNLFDRSERESVGPKFRMIADITFSTWPACTAPDPGDPVARAFHANAIISNPVTYGHVHCAEALAIPLHLMFPQPWCKTSAFPHPYSNLPYDCVYCHEEATLVGRRRRARNRLSYHYVDMVMWLGTAPIVSQFRRSLGLEPFGQSATDAFSRRIPFVKMWSPTLCPKPEDWGDNIDVVGSFFSTGGASSYRPPKPLLDFLASGPPPIFVGFGSMVIREPEHLLRTVLGAAAAVGARLLLQVSGALADLNVVDRALRDHGCGVDGSSCSGDLDQQFGSCAHVRQGPTLCCLPG